MAGVNGGIPGVHPWLGRWIPRLSPWRGNRTRSRTISASPRHAVHCATSDRSGATSRGPWTNWSDDSSTARFRCSWRFAVYGGRKRIGSASGIGYAQRCRLRQFASGRIGNAHTKGIRSPGVSAHRGARVTKARNFQVLYLRQTSQRRQTANRSRLAGLQRR